MARRVDSSVLLHEIARKALHLLIAFLPFIVTATSRLAATVLLSVGALYYIYSETIRLFYRGASPIPLMLTDWVRRMTLFSSRRQESLTFMIAPLTLALGGLLTILIFDGDAMYIGIYALAFGDTAAALIGNIFPVKQFSIIPGKSLGGGLACFVTVLTAAFIVSGRWDVGLSCAGAAALTELIPMKEYDNIAVPLVAGYAAYLFL
jgi:dolichol kinase